MLPLDGRPRLVKSDVNYTQIAVDRTRALDGTIYDVMFLSTGGARARVTPLVNQRFRGAPGNLCSREVPAPGWLPTLVTVRPPVALVRRARPDLGLEFPAWWVCAERSRRAPPDPSWPASGGPGPGEPAVLHWAAGAGAAAAGGHPGGPWELPSNAKGPALTCWGPQEGQQPRRGGQRSPKTTHSLVGGAGALVYSSQNTGPRELLVV